MAKIYPLAPKESIEDYERRSKKRKPMDNKPLSVEQKHLTTDQHKILILTTNSMNRFMKLLTLSFCLIWISNVVLAQDPRESEIRRLEDLERESVLKGDSMALFDKLWSPNMVVNTPANVVGTVEGTKAHFRSGNLSYLSFERTIEKITFNGNVAIVMGGEKIKPQGKQMNAGKVVTRRFTNVWMYSNNSWSIIARQATIIKVE